MSGYHQLSYLLYNVLCIQAAFATSQRVFPTEYAYLDGDYVTRNERASANCMNYPQLPTIASVDSTHFIHCNGTQHRLSDYEVGPPSQYAPTYYYEWSAGTETRQLLFIFPTRVNLTTITLHYFSNNRRGLPPLRFYAVPDDFNIWNATTSSASVTVAAIPAGSQKNASNTNISIDANFNTKKVLMGKAGSTYKFALSEVEFNNNDSNDDSSTTVTEEERQTTTISVTTSKSQSEDSVNTEQNLSEETNTTETNSSIKKPIKESNILSVTIGVVTSITLLVIAVVSLALILLAKKLTKVKSEQNSSYSVFSRVEATQHQQPQLVHFNDTYDQIKLSPLTGQAEFVSNTESENISNISQQHHNHPTHPSTASNQTTLNETSPPSPEQPTYAVVNKKKKKAVKEAASSKKTDIHCETEAAPTQDGHVKTKKGLEEKGTSVHTSKEAESLDELYAAVKKKPKGSVAKKEEPPPIPAHTVEELYTAVNKIPKVSAATKEEEEAPPIPAHTVEELYTAVNKTPKGNTADNEEEAPTIPPHTVEELYTAVNKTPKGNAADNKEEAPPIPPYTAGEM